MYQVRLMSGLFYGIGNLSAISAAIKRLCAAARVTVHDNKSSQGVLSIVFKFSGGKTDGETFIYVGVRDRRTSRQNV